MRVSPPIRALGVGLVASAMLGVVVFIGQGADAGQIPSSAGQVQGPDDWVPLTYDETQTEGGVQTFTYTVYRSSNGSVRRERHEGPLVEIMNRTANRFYRFEHGVWYEHPMRPQPAGGKPFLKLARNSVIQVEPSDPRVQTVAFAAAPLTFYEHRSATGIKVFCPELNLLEIWAQRQPGGVPLEIRVTSIVLGEPHAEFAPPQGVSVIPRADPYGPGRVTKMPSGLELRDGRLVPSGQRP